MKNFIYNPTSVFNKTDPEDTDTKEEYYTVSGHQDFIDDLGFPRIKSSASEKILAKQISRKDGSVKFMIKLSSNGKLANPLSIYGVEEDNSFLNRVCRSNKKFKEVNQKTFEWYTKFLVTRNIAWLHNAEREME